MHTDNKLLSGPHLDIEEWSGPCEDWEFVPDVSTQWFFAKGRYLNVVIHVCVIGLPNAISCH